ncbi:hypothetical protein C0J52_17765 [Blattella germanica]|nr:hypothetical protein C0J52_17765 [Blattella germanica]
MRLGKERGVPDETSHIGRIGSTESGSSCQNPTQLPPEFCGFHSRSFEVIGQRHRYLLRLLR